MPLFCNLAEFAKRCICGRCCRFTAGRKGGRPCQFTYRAAEALEAREAISAQPADRPIDPEEDIAPYPLRTMDDFERTAWELRNADQASQEEDAARRAEQRRQRRRDALQQRQAE